MDKLTKPLLFFSTGYSMYIGRAVDTVVHDHHAIQIVISIDNYIEVILSDSTHKLKALIIDSDVPHECRTYDNTFLLINIDLACKIGMGLKKICLANKKTAALPYAIVEKFLEEVTPWLSESLDMDRIFRITLQFLRELSNADSSEVLDDRIIKILDVLNQAGQSTVKVNDLAKLVFLSPSRLIHLFTAQVGIPIRKYILWARLLTSLQQIIDTKDITAAALEGGFSDAPHFNRTFKRMFGSNPTLLLNNSQFIQAYLE